MKHFMKYPFAVEQLSNRLLLYLRMGTYTGFRFSSRCMVHGGLLLQLFFLGCDNHQCLSTYEPKSAESFGHGHRHCLKLQLFYAMSAYDACMHTTLCTQCEVICLWNAAQACNAYKHLKFVHDDMTCTSCANVCQVSLKERGYNACVSQHARNAT